jgi:hypothetical protein
LISFLLFIAGTPKTVEACVCAGTYLTDREEAAREFAEATVVFEGEVLAGGRAIQAPTRDEPGLATIVFRVIRSYKGNVGDSIELYDASAGWDCSPGALPIGGKWFVRVARERRENLLGDLRTHERG